MKLKTAPATHAIPVLICSVVTEPDLARSLGAAGCLAKPVTQEALLNALAAWE
jgi:CheY-like chemotaxis protein